MAAGSSSVSASRYLYCVNSKALPKNKYINAAIGAIFLFGGIYCALAGHNWLPKSINLISNPQGWTYSLSYSAISVGLFFAVRAAGCCNKKPERSSIELAAIEEELHLERQQILEQEDEEDIKRFENCSGDIKETIGKWYQQIKKAREADSVVGTTSWKETLGRNERNQTFADFLTSDVTAQNANRRRLKIIMMDERVAEERESLNILADYIVAFHGIEVDFIDKSSMSLDDLNKRGGQYAYEPNLTQIMQYIEDDCFVLGVTSEDLYPCYATNPPNFIFHASDPSGGGILSLNRLNGMMPENTLHLMRMGANVLGTMRGLHHCERYSCCMQGVNSLDDSSQLPLSMCAQDMAKIGCLNKHLGHPRWDIKDGYRRQLEFFENFETKFHFQLPGMSRQIRELKRKIEKAQSDQGRA